MILPSDIRLEVGKVHISAQLIINGEFVAAQPFLVRRTATLEEYLAQTPKDGPWANRHGHKYFYYEVTTD
jgi:hypothetical protein